MKLVNIVLLLLILTGCGSALKINVDVMDREALRKQPGFIKLETEQLYAKIKPLLDGDSLNHYRAKLKIGVADGIAALVTDGTLDAASSQPMIDKINKHIDTHIQEVEKVYKEGVASYETVNASMTDADRISAYSTSKILFEKGIVLFSQLKEAIEKEAGKILSVNQFIDEIKLRASITDDELLNDVLTSSVVHAPDKYWKKVKVTPDFSEVSYNRKYKKAPYSATKVRTFMGNSDIAITMENKGHFTVKGVRLDAAKVVEASFKGLTQSINFLAQTSGIPVKLPAASSKTETQPVMPELAELTRTKAQVSNRAKLFNEETLNLVDILLTQRANLASANATTKSTAVGIIKSSFDAYKNQFKDEKEQAQEED